MNLDDDLLSHGETPHYHRRCIVSLLSSGWDQVVPMLYGRQEILLPEDPDGYSSEFGYAIFVVRCELSVRIIFTTTICFRAQIAWVLYGQASRAISIG